MSTIDCALHPKTHSHPKPHTTTQHPGSQSNTLSLVPFIATGPLLPCLQAYISTGSGIKSLVSDSQLLAVLDAIKPSLKHKQYVCLMARLVLRGMAACTGARHLNELLDDSMQSGYALVLKSMPKSTWTQTAVHPLSIPAECNSL